MLINNIEFASSQQIIEQEIEISQFKRAQELLDSLTGLVSFKLSGEVWDDKPALNVLIYGKISTLCQNCLNPVEVTLRHSGIVPIFSSESELDEALFGENPIAPDGVAADPQFDVLDFIEDEIIMLLPLAPKHEECVGVSYNDGGNNPFGMLKQLIN